MNDCIFCKIINKELPANIIDETDNYIVIEDINPKAPLHCLIIPKKHIYDVASLQEKDITIPGELFLAAKKLSEEIPGAKEFRLIVNNGTDAGQSVFHLHVHFVSGTKMFDF